jgi:hypothetical protein
MIAAAGEAGPLIGETGGRAGTPPSGASGGQGHQRRQPPGCAHSGAAPVYASCVADDTIPVATLESLQGADEAAGLLRANGIKCAVVDPLPSSSTVFGNTLGSGYTLVVALEDEERAKEALEGIDS